MPVPTECVPKRANVRKKSASLADLRTSSGWANLVLPHVTFYHGNVTVHPTSEKIKAFLSDAAIRVEQVILVLKKYLGLAQRGHYRDRR